MKILVPLLDVPREIAHGFTLRVFNLVRSLATNHQVTVILKDQANSDWLAQQIENLRIVAPRLTSGQAAMRQIPPRSYLDARLLRFSGYDAAFHRAVKECLDEGYDLVIGFGFRMAPYLTELGSVRTVCDLVDDPLKDKISHTWSLSAGISQAKTLVWIFVAYLRLLHKIDVILAVAEQDAAGIRRYSRHNRVLTIPNGVDINYFTPRPEGSKPVIVFTGNMDYVPNVNAVMSFAKHVWPAVVDKQPAAEFWVAGRHPLDCVKALATEHSHIKVLGAVDDMRDVIGEAWISVAPMVDGSGIKNKILEAWALAKPVVTTSLGSQGLAARDGQNILIADRPSDLSAAVNKLLQDRQLRSTLGESARQHVVQVYTWEAQTDRLIEALSELDQKPSA